VIERGNEARFEQCAEQHVSSHARLHLAAWRDCGINCGARSALLWGAVGWHAVSAASDVAARVLPQHRPHLVARRQPRDGRCVGRRIEGYVAALKVTQLQNARFTTL